MKKITLLTAVILAAFVTFVAAGCAGTGVSPVAVMDQRAEIKDLDRSNSSHELTLDYTLMSNDSGTGTASDYGHYSGITEVGTCRIWFRNQSFQCDARFDGWVAKGQQDNVELGTWTTITINYYEILPNGQLASEPYKEIPYDLKVDRRTGS